MRSRPDEWRRLDIGFGRGSVREELAYLGVDPVQAREIYDEGSGKSSNMGLRDGHVDFEGKHFTFKNVPLHLKPFQSPMPPRWYGVHSVESAERAARAGFNIVVNEDRRIVEESISRSSRRELAASDNSDAKTYDRTGAHDCCCRYRRKSNGDRGSRA